MICILKGGTDLAGEVLEQTNLPVIKVTLRIAAPIFALVEGTKKSKVGEEIARSI